MVVASKKLRLNSRDFTFEIRLLLLLVELRVQSWADLYNCSLRFSHFCCCRCFSSTMSNLDNVFCWCYSTHSMQPANWTFHQYAKCCKVNFTRQRATSKKSAPTNSLSLSLDLNLEVAPGGRNKSSDGESLFAKVFSIQAHISLEFVSNATWNWLRLKEPVDELEARFQRLDKPLKAPWINELDLGI